ncbi:MAG: HAD family phosphatase [Candidatus Omnitrophica bacterium]|nr:HAD family phosphatase [Candidatus Omnitrophota bacterium]
MSGQSIEAVIFDLGNVLIDFDYYIAINRISLFAAKSPNQIFELFFDSKLTALFEEAKISPEEFFSKVKEMLGLKLDYEGFLPIWNEIFFLTPKNEQVYKIAQELKDNYALALISNVNILHFDYIKKQFPALSLFKNIVTSCEVKATKPSPLIYQKALDELGASPQNTFYTDDRPELVEGARSLGIKGFIFKGAAQLRKDLLASGASLN